MYGTLLIRADASPEIGSGHVMRCLALAQAWQDKGGTALFVMAMKSPALEKRLHAEGIEISYLSHTAGSVEDAVETVNRARQNHARWVIVDGYQFAAAYQKTFKDAGLRLLVIDDMAHADHYYADIILNQNLHAVYGLYERREPHTVLLLGSRYVLLRREFLKWQHGERAVPEKAREVLVTVGGGKQHTVILKVVQALQQGTAHELQAQVIIGGGRNYYARLQAAVRGFEHRIQLQQDVTDMPELFARADVAISAGGSTCWELLFMGVPALILTLAENQKGNAEAIAAIGAGINLGWSEDVTAVQISDKLTALCSDLPRLHDMSRSGRIFIGADGAQRVLSIMTNPLSHILTDNQVRLRPAALKDLIEIWRLANDPYVRAHSFNQRPIPLDHHLDWYKKRLSSPGSCTFVAEVNGIHAGQIRYDRSDAGHLDLHFAVSPQFRQKGVGTGLLAKSCQVACSKLNARCARGIVLQSNTPSVKTFLKAGFARAGEIIHKAQSCYVFETCC